MSTFIIATDWENWIDEDVRNQITGTDDTNLDEVEKMAIQMVRDACYGKYDMDTELAKTTTSRNQTLIRWVMCIAVYFLYNKVNDLQIPDRVLQNYEDVRNELRMVAEGKTPIEFERLEDSDGYDLTSFEYGSEDRRSHDFY